MSKLRTLPSLVRAGSHWPATPDSGKINEAWDRLFLERLMNQDKELLLSYEDEEVYAEAGQEVSRLELS